MSAETLGSAMKPRAITTREFWLGVGAAVGAGLVACVALFATCRAIGSFTTEYSVNSEVPSPGGEQVAILFAGSVVAQRVRAPST